MPNQTPTRCSEPNCTTLVDHGKCATHQRPAWRTHSKQWQHANGPRWAKASRRYRTQHPTCTQCGNPATDVDHIIPIAEGGSIWDSGNWQSLCRPCHTRKTSNDNARRIRNEKAEREKLATQKSAGDFPGAAHAGGVNITTAGDEKNAAGSAPHSGTGFSE